MPTVDLRFMVYGKDEIKQATGYMIELNAASKDRVVAHDKEGHAMKRAMTATERYNKLSIKLLKIRTKDAEQGHMTAKQLDDQFERHQRILKATESTLKDYIQTDRVAITQEKRKQKLIADSTKATVKYNNETERLKDKYDSLGAAEKRYLKGQQDIARAFDGVENGSDKAKRAMAALKAEYEEFRRAHKSGTIVNAGNQFARYGDQAYRAQQRTKRFASVGLQQAGYQVNDFIVQVASGQNALVAFGQQGSQLAGIFGTGGAVVGALIAGAAALGNLIYQYYQSKKGVEELSAALEKLPGLYSDIESLSESLEGDIIKPWNRGAIAARNYAKASRDAAFESTGETFKRQLNAVESFWDSISRRLFGRENVTGLATAIQTEIEKVTKKNMEISALRERGQDATVLGKKAGAGYDLESAEARLTGLKKLKDELDNLFVNAETLEARVEELAKLRETYKNDAAVTAELDHLIKTTGYHELILQYLDDQNQAAEDRKNALDALALKTEKMGSLTEANSAREKFIAKQTLEMDREVVALKKAGVDLSNIEAMNALDALESAQLLALEKFDATAAEKERLRVAKEVAKALKQEQDYIEKIQAAARRVAEQQEKMFRVESDNLDLQREKNELLRLEADTGKKSEESLDQRILIAKELVSIRMTEKFLAGGITDEETDLIASAMQVAEQGIRFEDSLQRTLENTKLINAEISKMQGLIDGLSDFGTSIEKRINKASAQIKALTEGKDIGAAGTIADLRFKLQQDYDKAVLQSQQLREGQSGAALETARYFFEENNRLVDKLEPLLNDLASKKAEGKGGGGKTPKSALDILLKEERSMDLKLDQRRALIGLTDQEILLENTKYALMSKVQEQMATMNESEKAATIAKIDGIAQEMAAREEQIKLMEEVEAQNKHIADTIANSFGSALTSIVDGTKSVKDAFKSMARAIIAELFQIYVVKQITGMISGSIDGFLGGGRLAGGYSPGGKTYGSGANINAMQAANGGAFYGGNVIPFANGGVVGSPTNFGMSAGRTGLMGEAGPEAIMPLKRGANGKLGVQAEGGAGNVVIHQNFNFQANGDDSVKKIIAQAAPQIAQMTKSSIISDRRRGGQMKATFG